MKLYINEVKNLDSENLTKLKKLIEVYNWYKPKNETKEKYYGGAIGLSDVNLGIAIPKNFANLTVGCDWGSKCVDVLASRSMFDGFVSSSGTNVEILDHIVKGNNLISKYQEACKDELKFGCTFVTLSSDGKNGCKIRFHSPQTSSALWSGEKGRIDCGFAIIDTTPDEKDENTWIPSHINYYTDDAIYEIIKVENQWYSKKYEHQMGLPLMIPMIWNSTSSKPFGRSRLKKPIRSLIDGYIRTMANATLALEFDTTPQKYLLGLTEEQYEQVTQSKFDQYVGSIIASTYNPESGQNASFGQLSQGNLSPHVEMLRMLATQFSASTGLSVADTGVVNDANPTSSEAILAQTQTLICLAEQLNQANGDALSLIARMAQAICNNCRLDELNDEENGVMAHFKNPSMPSVSVTADAAIKIASARETFKDTDTFLEMIGFSQADIKRINAQESRLRGRTLLQQIATLPQQNEEEPQEQETEETVNDTE